ncbi:hypothetical protein HMPREF3208_01096 [Gardnerella vaginalis]|uniref:Uncharacterized protein n=1 Tax=Gardnerella vaginalis TaxID=2702 RepID=A0A133NSJ8_GARVA|nr:hypothetical protein HMPREF3208_01096 [Gardnerella vaginalis]
MVGVVLWWVLFLFVWVLTELEIIGISSSVILSKLKNSTH